MVGIRISPATNLQLAHLTAGTQPAACIPFTHNKLRTDERDTESNTRFITRNRVVLALSPLGKGPKSMWGVGLLLQYGVKVQGPAGGAPALITTSNLSSLSYIRIPRSSDLCNPFCDATVKSSLHKSQVLLAKGWYNLCGPAPMYVINGFRGWFCLSC